jgi:hypothetical protein
MAISEAEMAGAVAAARFLLTRHLGQEKHRVAVVAAQVAD